MSEEETPYAIKLTELGDDDAGKATTGKKEKQAMRESQQQRAGGKTESNQTSAPIPIASPSSSFNKNSQVPPPVPDEDRDPLDDDIIPASKKKKTQDSKWGIYLQWTILLLLIAFLACSIKIKFLNKAMFLSLDIWRWLALTVVVFCGRLISGWIMKLLEMLIEKHYILKKRVLYFVYGLRRAAKNCLWLALVLGVWESIFGGLENITAVNVLTKILWCLFTASISWMVKVLAVKVAANSFHRKAYFDRIQECIFNQYLLEILSGPPTMAGIPDTGSSQNRFKKQWTRSEKKKHKHQPFKDNESGEQKPQKHPAPQMQRSRRLSRQISIDTPGYTTVEVGEFPASSGSDIHTPSRRKVSITNPGPLIARSPIPIEQEKLQELTSDTVSVWTLRRLMKLIQNTNISTYSSIISQEKEEGEISSEVQAKAAAKQIFRLHGMPETIVSNRDPRFTSLFWKTIWENIGTRLQFSSSFHPQTDGQSEIANSVVLDLLKSYISDQKTQWERYLPLVEFAYNNTTHSSTGKAPFEIVEGAMKVPPFLSTKDKIFEADKYTRDLDTAFAKVRETLQKSQERQKKAADRHRRDLKLKENDWVLLRFDKARL
ncbi:hypothetical protein L7F22_013806 [Adiantum nelumboides]|nr:hypothetical protein [Adiantum nelumboides]